MKRKIYVIDTNIILQNIQNIINLSDNGSNIVVVPETVLLELEDKKKLFNELGYHSRSFARYLAKAKILKIEHKKDGKIIKLHSQDENLNYILSPKRNTILKLSNIIFQNQMISVSLR